MRRHRTSIIRWQLFGFAAYGLATATHVISAGPLNLIIEMVADSWPLAGIYAVVMIVPWALHTFLGGRYWAWAYSFAATVLLLNALWLYASNNHIQYMNDRGFPVDGLGVGVAIGLMFHVSIALSAIALNFGALAVSDSEDGSGWKHALALGPLTVVPATWLYIAVIEFGPIFRWLYR